MRSSLIAIRPYPAAVRSRAWALELAGWAIVALVGAVTLTQAFGWAGTRSVAVIQSLTPYFGLLVVAIAVVALWRRRLRLATVCAAIGFGILVVAAPLAFPDDQADPMADAVGLRVASVNLLYRNDRIDDVADDARRSRTGRHRVQRVHRRTSGGTRALPTWPTTTRTGSIAAASSPAASPCGAARPSSPTSIPTPTTTASTSRRRSRR